MGKTGKQGIKRMVAECDPDMIPRDKAERAAKLLSEFDLAQVRDVSAGAATFYVWVRYLSDMILFKVLNYLFTLKPLLTCTYTWTS